MVEIVRCPYCILADLKAINCLSGDVLAQEQITAAAKEKVLDALGEAASKLRGQLGESLANSAEV
jgi:eukaryotic-like serine/threonine-protein kinase